MDDVIAPNCTDCLTPLEAAGTERHPYWWCPVCKVARLS
jgi:formamidopyrimidine-DNA glycosylase